MHTTTSRRSVRARPFERRVEPVGASTQFESGFYLPLNDVPLASDGDAAAFVNGNLAVSWADSTFEGALKQNGELKAARAAIGLNGAATIELGLEAGADVNGTLRLAVVPLGVLTFGSVTVSPYLQVNLHLSATADADGQVSIVAPFHVGAGFTNRGGTPRAGTSASPRHEPEVGLPDGSVNLTGSVEVELVLVLLLAVHGLEIGGPVIGTTIGVNLTLDSETGPDLDGSIGVVGGWAFRDPLTLLPDIPEDLPRLHPPIEFDITAEDAPVPIGATSTRWSRVYDIVTDDHGTAVLPDGDGFVVVEPGQNPWLAALDPLGVPVWQNTAVDPWNPNGMVRSPDGDLVISGNWGTSLRVDRVDHLDPSGARRWSRSLHVPDGDWTRCAAAMTTGSGRTIIAGEVDRSSVWTPLLAALDVDGNVEWSIELDLGPGTTFPVLAALAETPSGDILAVGSVRYNDPTDPGDIIHDTDALVVRLSAEGDVLSAFTLGGAMSEEAMRILVHPDGAYTIAGHLGVAPNVWLAALRSDDTLRWSAAYQNEPDDDDNIEHANPTGLAPLDGAGLLVSGYIGSPEMDAWLMRVDDEGMPEWVKTFRAVGSADQLSSVIALPDGVAAVGRTQVKDTTTSDGDLWIVRANRDGMLRFNADSGLTTVNTPVEWTRIHDHTFRMLTHQSVATTLELDSDTGVAVDSANAFGELLT